MSSSPTLVGLLAMGLLLIPMAWMSSILRRHLARHHPRIWREMGEPGFTNLAANSKAIRVLRGRHRELGDPFVSRFVWIMRAFEGMFFLVLVIFAVLTISSS